MERLGMVKHLALADEHYWFRSVVGGEPLDFFPQAPNADWQVAADESAEDVFGLYREEIERKRGHRGHSAGHAAAPARSALEGMGDGLSQPSVHHASHDRGDRLPRRSP
jgi:hypothetical protein